MRAPRLRYKKSLHRVSVQADKGEGPARRNEQGLHRSGSVLLSRGQLLSTIAAERFNFRVRNGNGWVTLAIATEKVVGCFRNQLSVLSYWLSGRIRNIPDNC